jgi:cytochrome c biogenesis protein CcdA/thiol-disulfide isomerase/thioredoxin
MFLLFGAFIAGILTILAPCVLPLLPVIIGGSVTGNTKDKRRPLLIASSLALSLIVFTLLLKATSLLINIPPHAIMYLSGGIIGLLGIATLFPLLYVTIIARLGIEHRTQALLGTGTKNRNQFIGPIITGAALGPVFSSCSPVYGYILATVLPAHFGQAFAYIIAYVVGLALVLLAVGYYGQSLISRIKFASDPRGWFQRGLAVLFIVVGLLIISGFGTKLQVYAADHSPFKFDKISAQLIPKNNSAVASTAADSELYNVKPFPAPELTGLKGWINSDPLTLAQLKGKVVLIDFWTYTCINCIRTLPFVQGWYSTYQKDGLVVIGVHAPEFAFEKVPANVADAVKKDKLTYPVALDSDLATWGAFKNQYWPAEYLIDRSGNVRREHFGEGKYDETEKAIRGLLAEGSKNGAAGLSKNMVATGKEAIAVDPNQTPETYLGADRVKNFAGDSKQKSNNVLGFTYAPQLQKDQWSLSGDWQVAGDKITAKTNSKLKINFGAKNVYIVGGAGSPKTVGVSLDGKPFSDTGKAGEDIANSTVTIGDSKLYKLVKAQDFTNGILELTVPEGTDLSVFTFGN